MQSYALWSYDVVGNEKDGFSVNDRTCIDRNFEIPTTVEIFNKGTGREFTTIEPTDAQIVQALKDAGELTQETDVKDVWIYGDHHNLSLSDAKTGEPLFGLERN